MEAGKGITEGDGQKQETGRGAIDNVKRKVPPTKPTRSSARLRNRWMLPLEVFDNELLRKKILGYAIISGEDQEENRKTARDLRLVGKTWNETVIKLLYKRYEPLITIPSYSSGESLERLCNTLSLAIPINGYIPPFSLEISYLRPDNENPLCNMLVHCGEGLVNLNIRLAISWLACTSQFQNLSLPRLRKLEICIMCTPNAAPGKATSGQEGGETACSSLINSVARGATSLAEFTISLVFNRLDAPNQISDLSLPMTITNLSLSGSMRDGDVEVLVKKSLPNLTSLTLCLNYDLIGNGSIFKILDNYRVSLKKLTIQSWIHSLDQTPLFRFPIMEALEEFFFFSTVQELETGLERFLPKIHTLGLYNQTTTMLRNWIGYTKFISVTSLQLSLDRSLNSVQSWNMETMQSVNFAFPNVRNLNLYFSGTETSGLKYMFREMTQLTALKLISREGEQELNSDFWNAVLTGVSLETVAESREDPDFWERFDMSDEGSLGSITNLQELVSLTLWGFWQSYRMPRLIPDITLRRALLKMPNLKHLHLRSRFKATDEMAELWRSGGRSLEYSYY